MQIEFFVAFLCPLLIKQKKTKLLMFLGKTVLEGQDPKSRVSLEILGPNDDRTGTNSVWILVPEQNLPIWKCTLGVT